MEPQFVSVKSVAALEGSAAVVPNVTLCATVFFVLITTNPGPTTAPIIAINGAPLDNPSLCTYGACTAAACDCTASATVPCSLPIGDSQSLSVSTVAPAAGSGDSEQSAWAADNSPALLRVDPDCGNVHGDPHFVGLGGQKYKVDGGAGFYNLITSPHFQMNAYWMATKPWDEEFVIIAEVGIRYKHDYLYISRKARVRLNYLQVQRSEAATRFGPDSEASVLRDLVSLPAEGGPLITTPEFAIKLILRGYELDIKSVSLKTAPSADIHGLLGQTWNSTGWPAGNYREITDQALLFGSLLEGTVADYAVADGLFGSDFAFNRFRTDLYGPAKERAPAVSEYWLDAAGQGVVVAQQADDQQ